MPVSLVRTAATASIAAGLAALCWFNKLNHHEQEGAEAKARDYGSWLIGKARELSADAAASRAADTSPVSLQRGG